MIRINMIYIWVLPFTIELENLVIKSKLTSNGIAFANDNVLDAKFILAIIITVSAAANAMICGDIGSLNSTKSRTTNAGRKIPQNIKIKGVSINIQNIKQHFPLKSSIYFIFVLEPKYKS